MALFTIAEVITAKRALAVVTTRAALAAPTGVMIQRLWRGDLSPLRHARAHLVTIVTVSLWIMPGMAKSKVECGHVLRRARISAQLMTCAAG